MTPRHWIETIADARSVRSAGAPFDAPRPSPHLARWGIAPHDDDGVIAARASIEGDPCLVLAQDPGFLGGSIGASHAAVLEAAFLHARTERLAVVLVLASGGVRLHEANPAEAALARALRAMMDARAAGIRVAAVAVGDVFGGASVLACAASALAMTPDARLGLSGPKVIATARPSGEIDADDSAALAGVFGAAARGLAGDAELLATDADVRRWIAAAIRRATSFTLEVNAEHARLAQRLAADPSVPAAERAMPWRMPANVQGCAVPMSDTAALWRLPADPRSVIVAARHDAPVTPEALHEIDTGLLALSREPPSQLVLLEDSAGHEVSLRAERLCLSRFLAHHVAALGVLRAQGTSVRGWLTGLGHSAAFFGNALQGDVVFVSPSGRVMAMDPRAVARVTRLDPDALRALASEDPVLGHAAPLLRHWDDRVAVLPDDEARSFACVTAHGVTGREVGA